MCIYSATQRFILMEIRSSGSTNRSAESKLMESTDLQVAVPRFSKSILDQLIDATRAIRARGRLSYDLLQDICKTRSAPSLDPEQLLGNLGRLKVLVKLAHCAVLPGPSFQQDILLSSRYNC